MASSDSEGVSQAPNSRKRQRTSTSARAAKDGEDAKKTRGRPRVEAQDETAADRRRTQIRLAQRAYRQRKETTIASLKKQVTDLQTTIEEMNKAFLQFNDRTVSSGILTVNSEFARELRTTTEQFLTLARNASSGGSGSDGEDQDVEEIEPTSPKKVRTGLSSAKADQELTLNLSESNAMRDIGWGYTQQMGDTSTSTSTRQSEEPQNSEFLPGVRMSEATHLMQRMRDPNSTLNIPFFGLDDLQNTDGDAMDTSNSMSLSQFNALIPSPPAISGKAQVDTSTTLTLADGPFSLFPGADFSTPSPSPALSTKLGLPYTYSFQESTFARRLARAAIERGFHLISQSEFRPQRFAEVFGLTLRYSDRNDVRLRMRRILARGPNESLENCGGPFQNLGGAGTHYPKKDGNGGLIPRPDSWSEKRIGPFGKLLQREPSIGMDMANEMMFPQTDEDVPDGYEGEWFDANDVEGYLEERGLRLEAQAHFAEGQVTEIDDTFIGPDVERPDDNVLINSLTSPYENRSPIAADQQIVSKRPSDAQWNGIFHDLASFDKISGFDPSTLFPAEGNMALDLSSMGKINDFGSSAWFDEPASFVSSGNGTSPLMTTGSSAAESSSHGTPVADAMSMGSGVGTNRRKTRTVTVDVSKMIDELIRNAVCLGRTPGFRRYNVDQALHAALIAVH